MNRWMLTLDCSHRLISDERVSLPARDFCPKCAMGASVIACDPYFDEEAV